MYQVNICDSNWYPIRQVTCTKWKHYATERKLHYSDLGYNVGIMFYDQNLN